MKTKTFKSLIVTFAMALMIIGNTMTVFAASGGDNSEIAAYIAEKGPNMSSAVSAKFVRLENANDLNKYGANYRYYEYIDANGRTYYYVIDANEQDTVAATVARIQENQGKTEHINDDVLGGFSVGADTQTATNMLVGFQKPVSVLLGIIVFLVTMGMTVFTALDLSYIAFPVFREKCDDKKASGGMGTRQGKDGTTKLNFITDDAQHAVIAADTVQSGKSPFTIYLKSRMLSFVLLAIVIFILLTGNIGIFATLALKLVQGILDFLQGFQ